MWMHCHPETTTCHPETLTMTDHEAELVDLDHHKSAFTVTKSFEVQPITKLHPHFLQFPGTANASEVCSSPYEEIACAGCGYEIRDRYLLKVMNEAWHEACLRCFACQRPLSTNGTCFAKDGHVYCREDHSVLFGRKCGRCHQPLLPTDLVFRCIHSTYHNHCFTCVYCGTQFKKGDEYLVFEGEIVCTTDYHVICQAHMQNHMFDYEQSESNRKTPKRPRTILNAQQRKQFKAAFEKSSKPCRKVREQLAKETGLSVRVVQVWFQNQRAKMKKIQRKEGDKGRSGDSEGKSIEDNKSDSDDEVDSDTEITDSVDESMGKTMVQQENVAANPIEKLYNMQNTYFQFS